MDPATQAPSPGRVAAVVEQVLRRPELWPELAAVDDEADFVQDLVRLARSWELPLEADDVLTALRDRRREWLERWI